MDERLTSVCEYMEIHPRRWMGLPSFGSGRGRRQKAWAAEATATAQPSLTAASPAVFMRTVSVCLHAERGNHAAVDSVDSRRVIQQPSTRAASG